MANFCGSYWFERSEETAARRLRFRQDRSKAALEPSPRIIELDGQFACCVFARTVGDDADSWMARGERVFAVGRARLINASELAAALGANPQRRDLELLVLSYERWGASAFERLSGSFSVAIWDSRGRSLTLCRDQVGVAPLYCFAARDRFVFADDLDLLLSVEGAPQEVDFEWVANALASIHLPDMAERTAVKGVSLFPNGHCFEVTAGEIRRKRYWRLEVDERIRSAEVPALWRGLGEHLGRAVSRRIPDSGNVGFELSGGLDCNALLALARNRLAPERMITVSNVAPAWPGCRAIPDESDLIRLSIKRAGVTAARFVDGSGVSAADLFRDAQGFGGSLNPDIWSLFAGPAMRAAADSGCVRVLSGAGGDEGVSSKAGGAYSELLRAGQFGLFARELRAEGRRADASLLWLSVRLFRLIARAVAPDVRLPSLKRSNRRVLRHFLNAAAAEEFRIEERSIEYGHWYTGGGLRGRPQRLLDGGYLSTHRLPYSAALAERSGIELDYPLLDAQLLQLAVSLPACMMRCDGMGRNLIRQGVPEVDDEIRFRDVKRVPAVPWAIETIRRDRGEILERIGATRFAPVISVETVRQEVACLGARERGVSLSGRNLNLTLGALVV